MSARGWRPRVRLGVVHALTSRATNDESGPPRRQAASSTMLCTSCVVVSLALGGHDLTTERLRPRMHDGEIVYGAYEGDLLRCNKSLAQGPLTCSAEIDLFNLPLLSMKPFKLLSCAVGKYGANTTVTVVDGVHKHSRTARENFLQLQLFPCTHAKLLSLS